MSRRFLAALVPLAVSAALLQVPAAMASEQKPPGTILTPAPVKKAADAPASTAQPVLAAEKKAPSTPSLSKAQLLPDLSGRLPCPDRQAWVKVPGPADLVLAGWASCVGGAWRMDVVSGSGHVGNMTLRPSDFSGQILMRDGAPSGQVGVRLPQPPNVVPSWRGRVTVLLRPIAKGWTSNVTAIEAGDGGSLRMSGPLNDDGTFRLAAKGSVNFAGTTVALAGSYTSGSPGVRGRGSTPSWNIDGTGKDGSIPGAKVLAPTLLLTQAAPGIVGQATVRLSAPAVDAPATLAIQGSKNWTARLSPAGPSSWSDPQVPGLSLVPDQLSGTIGVRRGTPAWNVRMPMRLITGSLTVRGQATVSGPGRMSLAARSGFGDLFRTGSPVNFWSGQGALTLQKGRLSGRIGLNAPGEQLMHMPSGWNSMSTLVLTPRSGSTSNFTRAVRYSVSKGGSLVNFVGPLPTSGDLKLKASGFLKVAQGRIPAHGSYTGPGPQGSATRPSVLIQANTAWSGTGKVSIGHGASLLDTVVTMRSEGASVSTAAVAPRTSMPTVTYSPKNPTTTVELDVTTTSGDTIKLDGTIEASDGGYTITVAGASGETWSPYSGLTIDVGQMSGTITVDDSLDVTDWSISTGPAVNWEIADGVTLTTTLTLSSSCPLTDHCPTTADDSTFYVGGSSTVMNIPSVAGVSIPNLDATGAFRADGSWVRWDGETSDAVTIVGPADSTISMNNASVTVFSGERDDPTPNLGMPDLSKITGKNDVNVQVCGTFQVTILDLDTGAQQGCLGLTPVGTVLGQTNTGGAVSPIGAHNGLTLDASQPPTLSGFAWSDIDPVSSGLGSVPTMQLFNQAIALIPKKNSFTANVVIPASLMKSFGTGIDQATTFTASGWFTTAGDFEIDLSIPVNLQASGVHLDTIDTTIKREKESAKTQYDLKFDATGEMSVSGHHYPFDANIELKTGTEDEALVSLAVVGTESSQSVGQFDDTSLLSEGDFEPPTTGLLDGSFDDSTPASDFADGGFESGTASHNLVSNSSMEDSASVNLLPQDASTFDGSVSGNLLSNPSFDDTDNVYNGDFEGLNGLNPQHTSGQQSNVLIPGWGPYDTQSTMYLLDEAGPNVDGSTGSQVMCVSNSASSSSAKNYQAGAWQMLKSLMSSGSTYVLSGYVTSDVSSSTTAQVALNSTGSDVTAPSGSWNYFTVTVTPTGAVSPSIYLNAKAQSSVCFDQISFAQVSGPPNSDMVSGVAQPDVIETFDGNSSSWDVTASGGVSRVNDTSLYSNGNGVLKTDGCSNYWTFKNDSRGYLNAASTWDMSVNVYFPGTSDGSSGREIADVGFLLSGSGAKVDGYIFRLQTAHGDGGFYRVGSGSLSAFGGTAPNLAFKTWYTLRLSGYSTNVTAQVTKMSDGSVVYENSAALPSTGYRNSGAFGQWPDNACHGGSYWDDFKLASTNSYGATVSYGNAARSAPGYASLTGTVEGWGYLTTANVTPSSGITYAYSAWVRSKSGQQTGNLTITTVGGSASEARSTPFTAVDDTWTNVLVALPMQASHTDLRVGVTGMGASGTLWMDDQELQQMGWTPYPADPSSAPTMNVATVDTVAINTVGNPSFENDTGGWNGQVGGQITRTTSQAWVGSASGELSRASGSTGDDYAEYIATGLSPSTTYRVSAYVWLPKGASASQVYDSRDFMWAVDYSGNGAIASTQPDFSQDDTWQRVSATVTTTPSGNQLNVRFYAPTGGGWFIDGVMVEEGPALEPYFEGEKVIDNDNQAMYVKANSSSGNSVYAWLPEPTFATSVYTLTARVKSVNGGRIPASLNFWDSNGLLSGIPVTITGEWTTIGPLTVTSVGGSNQPRVEIAPESTDAFYVDDVTLLASETTSGQDPNSLGALSPPQGWTGTSGTPVLVNSQVNARTGVAYLRVPAGGTASYNIPTSITPGQTFLGQAWVKSPSGAGNIPITVKIRTLDANGNPLDSNSVSVTADESGFTRVPLTMAVSTSGAASIQLQLVNGSSSYWVAFDDMVVQLAGMTLIDPWGVSGSAGLVAVDDAAKAHSGNDYLALNVVNSGGATLTKSVTPTSGARSFSAWIKSSTGSSMTATLSLSQSGGNAVSQKFAAGSQWLLASVTLPVTAGSAGSFTSQISLGSTGLLLVDDVATRDVAPFVPTGSGVTATVITASTSTASSTATSASSGGASATEARTGAASVSPRATCTTPCAPSTVSASKTGDTSIALSWSAASSSMYGINGYWVLDSTGKKWGSTPGSVRSVTLSNLPYGTYQFKVAATYKNSSGQVVAGAYSALTSPAITLSPPPPANPVDPPGASSPPNYLMVTTNGSGGVSSRIATSVTGGSSFTVRAHVIAAAGTTVAGTIGMNFDSQAGTAANPQLATGDSPNFTADDTWTQVTATFVAPGSGTFSSITPTFNLSGAGTLFIDTVSVTPVKIVQDQPWSTYTEDNNTTITWGVYDNPSRAHDGSNGVLQFTRNGAVSNPPDQAGLLKTMDVVPTAGQVYSSTVWVRSPDAKSVTFKTELIAEGSSSQTESANTVVTIDDSDWHPVTVQLPIKNSGHTDLRASLLLLTSGVTVNVDDVSIVQNQWSSAGTGWQQVIADGNSAYQGTGFARLNNTGTTGVSSTSISAVTPATSTQKETLTAYVRTMDDTDVSGAVQLSGAGCSVNSAFVAQAGVDWQKVQVSCTPSSTDNITMTVSQVGGGHTLDVDSVAFTDQPGSSLDFNNVYGIDTPLNHPSSGYLYLWDDAFGIPGMHLWGVTAQVEIVDGEPGLGMEATVYQDPDKIPNLLFGSDWIQGTAVVNIDEAQPCFDFGFKGVDGDSGVSIAKGALKASDFNISFAPRGCAVGSYVVPPGASLAFDAAVGDGTVSLDMALSENEEGQPYFSGDVAVGNLNIGGIQYHNLAMSAYASATDDSVSYVADMQLPMGSFDGSFDMTGNNEGVHVDGSVDLQDWGWTSSSGKGLQVNDFSFDFGMDVGSDNCGSFYADANADANADFASASNLDFTGHVAMDCGNLTELQLQFDYTHGDITQDLYLNYDDASQTLAGGVAFDFTRKVSWKVIGIRYHRTSHVTVKLDFSMDVTSPESSTATLYGYLSVNSGSGTVGPCTINGQPDDACPIEIDVKSPIIGTVKFDEDW